MGPGTGIIVCILLPVILLLFGVLSTLQTVSAVLLLAGLWSVVYGLAFGTVSDRLYSSGAGVVVIAISTFIFLPWPYVLGLVLTAVMALAVVAAVMNGRHTVHK